MLGAYGLVLRRLSLGDAHQWLAELRSGADFIRSDPEDYLQASMRAGQYPDQPITLFDAPIAVMRERREFPIWTFDHHFDVMGTKVWR